MWDLLPVVLEKVHYLLPRRRCGCGHTSLTTLRTRYDHAVAWGILTNRHRSWVKGNHPGYTLAKRLHDKADQVFTFTRNLAVPWTNNASEQALTGNPWLPPLSTA